MSDINNQYLIELSLT